LNTMIDIITMVKIILRELNCLNNHNLEHCSKKRGTILIQLVLIDDLYLKMYLYPNRIFNLMNQKNLNICKM
jgi:hypothetical protein